MGHRVNVILDDKSWGILKNVPRGDRSHVVTAALSYWSKSQRRRSASEMMETLKTEIKSVSTREIVNWIRRDRNRKT